MSKNRATGRDLEAELERWKHIAAQRKKKKSTAHIARNRHADGMRYWRERALLAETTLERMMTAQPGNQNDQLS